MIGGDTAASAGSNRAAADHPPAQPLSLLAVLQQEFKGNSTVRRQAQARRSTASGPQMKIWLGFIGGSTVCPLRVPPSAGALYKDFPHESTADQWFSESQMESYRALSGATSSARCVRQLARRRTPLGSISSNSPSLCTNISKVCDRPRVAERPANPRLTAGLRADSLPVRLDFLERRRLQRIAYYCHRRASVLLAVS